MYVATAPSQQIPGLRAFLDQRGAGEHAERIEAWCAANGAVFLSEVHENWEEVLDDLALPAGERQRLIEAAHDERAAERIRAWLRKSKAELPPHLRPGPPAGPSGGRLPVIPEDEC